MKGKFLKAIVSLSMAFILCISCVPSTVYAQSSEHDMGYVNVYDAELGREVQVGIKSSDVQSYAAQNVYNYEIYLDGQIDYWMQVDIEHDMATLWHIDGRIENLKVSDAVTVTEVEKTSIPDIVTEGSSAISLYAVDYVDNETFVLLDDGTQASLGTQAYDGYEAMGRRIFANPTETGYLQRRAGGQTDSFYAYRFEIAEGTAVGAALGFAASMLLANGVPIAEAVVASLLNSILPAGVGTVVDSLVTGEFECREYRWDYRVRRSSNTGTILLSDYKYRYFWTMYSKTTGKRAFELRNDLRDGWLLSNAELIAHALGRS